jgi:enoyl-CoA hydratase/carnithine racemase
MNAAFIRIGLSACDVGVSYFLPRIVGSSIASELLLTGDFIDAPRALAAGLASRVVPDTELDREDRNQILTTRTSDVREGIAAFLEKREPKYEDA